MNKYDWAKINRAANAASKRIIASAYLDRLLLIQVATSASDQQPSSSEPACPTQPVDLHTGRSYRQ